MTSDVNLSTQNSLRGARFMRALSLLLGAALVLYALSDHPFYGGEPGFGSTQLGILVFGIVLALTALLPLRWNKRILLMVVSLLFALILAELAAEVVLAPRFRPAYEADSRLIFKLTPNRTIVSALDPANGGGTVAYRINADGFRGDELRPRGTSPRIVVYGDSFIHAYYAVREETFVSQLGSLLEQKLGTAVEVINAGVSSYGPDQILLKLEDELPTLQPDLVIVAIFAGNDYGDLIRNKLFKVDDTGVLVPNDYELSEELAIGFELNQRESTIKRALRGHLQGAKNIGHTRIAAAEHPLLALLEFTFEQARREYQNYIIEGSDLVTNAQVDYFNADLSVEPRSASAVYKVRLMGAVLEKLVSVADGAQVPLVLMFIPHPMNVLDEFLGGQVDRQRFPDYHRRNLVGPLEDMAERMRVPFVSLYEPYRRRAARELYLRGGDDHWSAAGQRLAAQVMAEYLVSNELLQR